MKSKKAFTLAEVLITLGIIGVVAALTLPSLIQKQNEKVTVTRLKKSYSILQQAYLSAINENGDPSGWFTGTNSFENATVFANNFKPFLKVSKDCGMSSGC